VNFARQRLSKLSTADVGHRMQCQAVVQLIMIQQVFPNTVDDQVKQLVLFVQEQGNSQIPNLLFGVFIRRDEIDSLEVTKVDIVSLDVNVEELAHIFLLLVPVEISRLELLSNIGQLLIHSLLLQFSGASIAQIRNELHQSSHRRHGGVCVALAVISGEV